MIRFLLLGWLIGAAMVGLFVWAGARKERMAFEAGERRIAAAEAEHAEHMRALREWEDEQFSVAVRMNDELAGFGSAP